MQTRGMISIWFFIGLLLTVYGALIVAAALLLPSPPGVVLTNLHAGLWWGAVLFLVGLFYAIHFRPRASRLD
jgi:hypothetical protein